MFIYSDIDDIHNMINNVAESQDITKEISEALSNPIRSLTDTTDDVRKIIFGQILILNRYSRIGISIC